ncbi:DNA gyrase, A subunit [Deferribacter desulfuricans SSM1]|uniref:DNA gyrase subunit A n=1 Tax=Deferribacter desulfuricans (strain DSM 14783 / JCM 11476 / NBRC 101012 / SSM1) TaxID=639282 RepID=D3PA93_DEFDS|nr:DNA gyrase subunit A [Deferribacter desulfuricans]BAI79516.1 DNA gyrase, A subunit [Deferribacter desulfuricans SSM1]
MKEKGIIEVNIEDSLKDSYLDYAMSVIIGRALPDVRDGLKPVHRRVLYAMYEMGVLHNKPYKKSARIVGDVIGKYHPHGDSAVYDTLVRMAQDFSMRYPLVDGQGNFGSIDGDSAAAMRYTEVRMTKIAEEMLSDIDKDTVDFSPNYDGSLKEPVVLPTRIPNMLINGTSGIAVGMATNIPPHNLTEVIDALVYIIDNPSNTDEEILNFIKGPDFPTYGIIYGKDEILKAYKTGKGVIKVRAKVKKEITTTGKELLVVTELPYQVNKANLIEKIANLARDKKINGIVDLRDESDRDGIRIVIELKRGENADIIINQLYKFTQMEIAYGINLVGIVNNKPKTLTLRDLLEQFLEHRKVVVIRRTKFLLKKAEDRLHILEGLIKAVENIDEVVALIKSSKNAAEAKEKLMNRFELSDKQAQAILDMRLHRLTGLEIEKLRNEYKETLKNIEFYKSILNNKSVLMGIIKEELIDIKNKYGDERRTQIVNSSEEINIEDLIPDDEVVVTLSYQGFIKRTPLSNFKSQKRGGKGKTGAGNVKEDFIKDILVTTNHSTLMFFTNKGRIHYLKVYELPELARDAKGKYIANLISLDKDEKVAAMISTKEFDRDRYIFMCTKEGIVKKTSLDAFSSGRSGIIAIKLRDGDEIVDASLISKNDSIFISTRKGKCIQFNSSEVRNMGRNATGVKGITLTKDDKVVSMEAVKGDPLILTVTTKGFGKSSLITDYRIQSRGGKGIKLSKVTERTGEIVGARQVKLEDDVMLISKSSKVIRLSVSDIPILGRDTQGVKLMGLDDEIISFDVIRED